MEYTKASFVLAYTSLFLKHRKEPPRQLAELWVRFPSPQDARWLLDMKKSLLPTRETDAGRALLAAP